MKYFSEELNKNFDTIEELEAAEKAFKEENEKKLADKEARKAEAKVVEDAYSALTEAKKARTQVLKDALEEYRQACSEAKEKYLATRDAQDLLVKKAEEAKEKALDEFTKKHPEGFHLTLHGSDGSTTTISTNTYKAIAPEFSDFFKEVDDFWTNMFKGWF